MSQELELTGPAGTLTLDAGEIIAKDLEKIPTGVGTARIEVPENDNIIPFVQRQDRVNYRVDGNTVFTGYAVGFAGNERTGRWTLRVDGIGKRLEETRPDYDALGGSLTYSNIALDEALKDYWPRTPFSATVTDQTPEVVAEDEEVQSADTTTEWQNISTLADSDPFVIENGVFRNAQTGFHQDPRDANGTFGTTNASQGGSSDYVDGAAALLDASGDSISTTKTLEHTIPSNNVGFAVRWGADDTLGIDFKINGQTVDSVPASAGTIGFGWNDAAQNPLDGDGWTGGDLSGDVDLAIDVTTVNSGEEAAIDWMFLYDTRYNYFFDDTTDANQELAGPEKFPNVSFEFDTVGTAFNISRSEVTLTINDTTNQQAVSASNDGGATYTQANNTNTVTVDYADAGREARTRVTLSRFSSGDGETPTDGDRGQEIDSYNHLVDLTNEVVIDKLELSRNHFDNLKKLHEYGDFLWTIEHDDAAIGNLTVNSYPRGQITRPTPDEFDDPVNINPEVAAETYFNSIFLQGALQDDGTRPTAEVKLDDTIASDNREISPGVLRDPSISTEAGASFRANALLTAAVDKNDLRGSITAPPVYAEPGYNYSVDFGEGKKEKTLERVSIRESAGRINATYEFVVKEALAETIDELKQNSRDIGNQV